MQNKVGLSSLPPKYMSALENLASKALSIEKRIEPPKIEKPQIQIQGPIMHTNLRYEVRKKTKLEALELPPKKNKLGSQMSSKKLL